MTTYNIDYSDPLRTGFTISPGGLDGPGGTTSHTSLRLYGRGALEWGESVDENFVRLNENFAGATPPVLPVGGQLWLRQALYVKNGSSFFRWNIANNVWDALTVTTIAGSISGQAPGVALGSYVYSTADAVLYRWDTAYKQKAAAWLPRTLTVQAANPTTQKPAQALVVYDEYIAAWVLPSSTTVGSGIPPAGNYDGQFYYDTATGKLYIWNASAGVWQQILGPADPGGVSASSGNIDMQNLYSVINLVTPNSSQLQYAATVDYVNNEISTAIANLSSTSSGLYVTKTGGSTMNGTYTLTGTLNASATVSASTLSGTTGNITTITSTTGTITGLTTTNATATNLSVTTTFNANNIRLLNVATPLVGTDGANATYVNNVGTSTLNSANATMRAEAARINPPSYRNGDIHIPGTGRIYMWLDGAFRQIWPATYS